MLGKQDMYITVDELFDICRRLRYKLKNIKNVNIDKNGMIDSYSFF